MGCRHHSLPSGSALLNSIGIDHARTKDVIPNSEKMCTSRSEEPEQCQPRALSKYVADDWIRPCSTVWMCSEGRVYIPLIAFDLIWVRAGGRLQLSSHNMRQMHTLPSRMLIGVPHVWLLWHQNAGKGYRLHWLITETDNKCECVSEYTHTYTYIQQITTVHLGGSLAERSEWGNLWRQITGPQFGPDLCP